MECGKSLPLDSNFCTVEEMFTGQSFGDKPPWIVLNLYNIVGGLFLCWMLFNHFVFNKDFFGQFQVEKDVEFKDEVLK